MEPNLGKLDFDNLDEDSFSGCFHLLATAESRISEVRRELLSIGTVVDQIAGVLESAIDASEERRWRSEANASRNLRDDLHKKMRPLDPDIRWPTERDAITQSSSSNKGALDGIPNEEGFKIRNVQPNATGAPRPVKTYTLTPERGQGKEEKEPLAKASESMRPVKTYTLTPESKVDAAHAERSAASAGSLTSEGRGNKRAGASWLVDDNGDWTQLTRQMLEEMLKNYVRRQRARLRDDLATDPRIARPPKRK